jgi:hypothetical protein
VHAIFNRGVMVFNADFNNSVILLPNLIGKPFIYFLSEFFEKLICFNLIHVF